MGATLFVTMPHFEQSMPSNLVGPGQKYWRAVTLSVESPWYLFVYEAQYGQQKEPQTTLVSWESALLEILECIPAADRKGIARVEKERNPGTQWNVRWLETIWVPAAEEADATGLFLLQLEGDPQLRDAHLQPVPSRGGRSLVYSAPPKSVHRHSSSLLEVPDDFPAPAPFGVVPGTQPKVGAREGDGAFTNGSVDTRAVRYEICQDLVNQLVAYIEYRRLERVDDSVFKLVAQVSTQVRKKQFGWRLSPAEADWISNRVKAHFAGHQ